MTYQLTHTRRPSVPLHHLSAALATVRDALVKAVRGLTVPAQLLDDPDFGRLRGWPEHEVQLRRWPY